VSAIAPPVKVFISYSRDTPEHCKWVVGFAQRLKDRGITVILDEWDLRFGADTASFMWQSVQEADRVLVVCTDGYVAKAEGLQGGSGYETMILNAELIRNLRTDKFIPVYCPPVRAQRLPVFLGTRRFVDLSNSATEARQFEEMIEDLRRAHTTAEQTPAAPAGSAAQPGVADSPHGGAPEARAAAPMVEVYLALSACDVLSGGNPAPTSALVVTDEWKVLAARLAEWRDKLARDPGIPAAARQTSRSASLEQLIGNPMTRGRVLGWLSLTPFSAYVYYAQGPALSGAGEAALREKFFVVPLLHRLSKKSQRVVGARSDVTHFETCVADAVDQVATKFHRVIAAPTDPGRAADGLVALARLVAGAVSAHLARPGDGEAAAVFESLRTRIRFAQNVVSGERHTRDENPLP
jgi:TIR domain-containing protein